MNFNQRGASRALTSEDLADFALLPCGLYHQMNLLYLLVCTTTPIFRGLGIPVCPSHYPKNGRNYLVIVQKPTYSNILVVN